MNMIIRRIISFLMLLSLLLSPSAFAASDADEHLLNTRWEMNVTGWDNTSYMNFYNDGVGIWEIPAHYQSATESYDYFITYSFTWYTIEAGDNTYITIAFKGDYPGYGWGCLNVPYQINTYLLLWNPDMMYLFDTSHSGIDARGFDAVKTIELKQPTSYTIYHF